MFNMEIDKHILEDWYKKNLTADVINISEYSIEPMTYGEVSTYFSIPNDLIESTTLSYATEKNLTDLKEKLSVFYKASPENILITNGASEAIFIILSLMAEYGCNIITQSPFYYNYEKLLNNYGMRLQKWNVLNNVNCKKNINILKELINNHTKLILLNNISNPTGIIFSSENLLTILEYCKKFNIYVAVDEVGLPFRTDELNTLPIYKLSSVFGISIGSLSKLFGVPGIRVGWIVSNPEVIKKCETYKDVISISNSELSLIIANRILSKNEDFLSKRINIIKSNICIIEEWIKRVESLDWEKPLFNLSALIKYKRKINSFDYCKGLLNRKKVFVAPGSCFNVEFSFRISLACNIKNLIKGLQLIEEYEKEEFYK